jgi:DNA-binding transcriptional regulator YiaG
LKELIDRKDKLMRGEARPAAVWEVKPGAKGKFTHRKLDVKEFQRLQKQAWDCSIAATRQKLGLSQRGFAGLLGISVRTLHHWEQGSRKPSGAARVLLRLAEKHPELVLEAAA